ncbi:hypothetical protein BJ741DRAFT_607411 [Chytriomyces cf. hyalinus JEL632]|nr:hypothetical protein BJ741DRAFT_607411 [Chytriomyces cf. hyalinus JEL632]
MAEFPIATKHVSQFDVCGVATDIVCTKYAGNRVFVVVSQCGNIGGTVILATHDRSERRQAEPDVSEGGKDEPANANIKTLLGSRNDPLVHVYGTHLLGVVSQATGRGVGTELLLTLALKGGANDADADFEESGRVLKGIADAVAGLLV